MIHFFWPHEPLSENSYIYYEDSNNEIPKWAEFYLSNKMAFHLAFPFTGRVTENPNDILLGHLTWDNRLNYKRKYMGKLLRNWVKENAISPSMDCHPNTYILTPWVPEFPVQWTRNMPYLESQLLAAKKIFALCGSIWIDRTFAKEDNSIQDKVKNKLVQNNMGVASQNLGIKKETFNVIGERQILHMSNLANYKGFDLTCHSLKGLDTLLHVATSSIKENPGLVSYYIDGEEFILNFIGYVDNSDVEFNSWVVENCDFYIHTARMDAQATTVLENAARGLIPLVTPESGFACPHAIYLTHDASENRQIIQQALEMPEEELIKRSILIREYVEREHSWEKIYNRIWNEISKDI